MDDSVTTVNLDPTSLGGQQARALATHALPNDKGLFAEQLARVQAQKELQPAALGSETKTEEPEAETPKIARSWRMAGVEKATEVQENLDLDWDDVVDLLNPLQHIPIVGTIYRELTGDKISPEIQIAGSIAFGALTGSIAVSAVAGIASAAYEQSTGQEATVQIAQALFGNDLLGGPSDEAGEVQMAAADLPVESTLSAPKAAPVSPVTTEASSAPPQAVTKGLPSFNKGTAMAATTSKNGQGAALAAASGGMRIGNIIYAGSSLKSAAKISTPSVDPGKESLSKDIQEAREALASMEKEEQSWTERASSERLGIVMQEQAQAHAAGSPLPPELVHDMMLIALDKYKAAHALAESGIEATP